MTTEKLKIIKQAINNLFDVGLICGSVYIYIACNSDIIDHDSKYIKIIDYSLRGFTGCIIVASTMRIARSYINNT